MAVTAIPQHPRGELHSCIVGRWWTDSRVLDQVYFPVGCPWSAEAIHQQHYHRKRLTSNGLYNYGVVPHKEISHSLTCTRLTCNRGHHNTSLLDTNICILHLDKRKSLYHHIPVWCSLELGSHFQLNKSISHLYCNPQVPCTVHSCWKYVDQCMNRELKVLITKIIHYS